MTRSRAEEECGTLGEAYDEGYQQGGADAIDEFVNKLNGLSEFARPAGWSIKVEMMPMSIVRDLSEQMKEHK